MDKSYFPVAVIVDLTWYKGNCGDMIYDKLCGHPFLWLTMDKSYFPVAVIVDLVLCGHPFL